MSRTLGAMLYVTGDDAKFSAVITAKHPLVAERVFRICLIRPANIALSWRFRGTTFTVTLLHAIATSVEESDVDRK